MLVLENILLALGSLRANKMRALLTILGIIIGIASVIAIMSVGNSIRSSVTSSMESMGANHITVGLRQKEPEEEVTEEGYRFEGEMQQASMTEEDYLTNEMLEDAEKEFADKIDGVLLSENVGEGQAKDGKLSSNVTLMGVNTAFLKNQDLKLLSGRLLTERDQKEKKGVVVVSDRVVRKLFDGDTKKAAGSQTEVYLNIIITPLWASMSTTSLPLRPCRRNTFPRRCTCPSRRRGSRRILRWDTPRSRCPRRRAWIRRISQKNWKTGSTGNISGTMRTMKSAPQAWRIWWRP